MGLVIMLMRLDEYAVIQHTQNKVHTNKMRRIRYAFGVIDGELATRNPMTISSI